jgi:signal transduction histidine kinase
MVLRTAFWSHREWLIAVLRGPIVVAVAYYIGAKAAFMIGTLSDQIFAPFWPPNVILLAALLATPYRHWPLYLAAAFPPHLAAEIGVGMGWLQLVIAFATNCFVAMLSAFGIRALVPTWRGLDSLQSTIVYVLIAAVASPALCAFGGAFVRIAGDGTFVNYGPYWAQWFLANALASLTLGAAILACVHDTEEWTEFRTGARFVEAILLAGALVGTCILAFSADGRIDPGFLPALSYLPVSLTVWAAVRFRTKGASTAVLIVTVTSIALTLQGPTIFLRGDAEENVLALQAFLAALAIPILLLGACVSGLRQAEKAAAALAGFVLGSQDEERRQVARRLHEDIGQNLAAAGWLAEQVEAKLPSGRRSMASQLASALSESMRDLRSLSYLLHPPLLEEGGLPSALRALAEDYAQRCDIGVELHVSEDLGRLSPTVELTMYRVVEEALANIGRNTRARVSVGRPDPARAEMLVVAIEDIGRSIVARVRSQQTQPPTGRLLSVARMRERLRAIGGTLDLATDAGRLTVRATIPTAEQDGA